MHRATVYGGVARGVLRGDVTPAEDKRGGHRHVSLLSRLVERRLPVVRCLRHILRAASEGSIWQKCFVNGVACVYQATNRNKAGSTTVYIVDKISRRLQGICIELPNAARRCRGKVDIAE